MNEETVLNPALTGAAAIPGDGQEITLINPALPPEISLLAGGLVDNRFAVTGRIESPGGEADLFLCHDQHQGGEPTDLVLKLYRRPQALKQEVAQALQTVSSPCIARILAQGTWQGRAYEVNPYYPLGSLDGQKISCDVLRQKIIPQLTEALHTLHRMKILHKDLKPSNIMLRTDQHDIALIDFGVSSMRQEGSTVLLTSTGLTPHYAAPETFRNLFLEESDYYAMGVTLCALYQGHSPYHGMTQEQIMQLVALQKLPIPADMPDDLHDLITGLTYPDITNRNDPDNPNRRWTHREVIRWLRGEKQPVPGGRQVTFVTELTFCGKKYTCLTDLTDAIIREWNNGKRALTNGTLAAAFRRSLPGVAPLCDRAQKAARSAGGREDVAYMHLLYELLDDTKRFIWQGETAESTTSFGTTMLSDLQEHQPRRLKFYGDVLAQRALSAYVAINHLQDTPQAAAITALEDSWVISTGQSDRQLLLCFQAAYLLSGQRKLQLGKQTFYTPAELAAHMQALGEESFRKLQRFCHDLITVDFQLDPQFEAWLSASGMSSQLAQWKAAFHAAGR